MSEVKRLFNSLNLHVEDDSTITKSSGGIRSVVKCNNKPIVVNDFHIRQFSLRNRSHYIVFNTQSKGKDCIYLSLEKYTHEALSAKINLIVSNILKLLQTPEVFNIIQSQKLKQLFFKLVKDELADFDTHEDILLNKWIKINEKLSEKTFQDGLVSLNYKLENICVEDDKIIQYFNEIYNIPDSSKCIFTYFSSYISVEFPIYSLLKTTKNQLLGVKVEKNELEIFKAIYQYIFQNIETKNAYSLMNKSLLRDKLNHNNSETVHLVESIDDNTTPTMLLIESFNTLAIHIDGILDDMVDIDKFSALSEKFNLHLTHEEIDRLRSCNLFASNFYFGSSLDTMHEINSNPRIKFEEFNKQLNEASQNSSKNGTLDQSKVSKSRTYKNKSISIASIQGFSSFSMLEINKFENNSNILDSTSESFESKIPNNERKRHTYILAGSGSGKTSLLETFLYADCQKKDQSTVIFDLMGKATKSVLKFVKDPSRVLVIDPHLHRSITPIINPFELKNKDELSIENRTKAIINAFDIALNLKDGWSVNMKAVLAPCISTLLRKGGSDIYELQRFMNDEVNEDLRTLGEQSPIKGHRSFFLQEFSNESYEMTKNAISAKLQVFLNDPTFANLVTGKSTINLEQEVNTKGKIIIFKLTSRQILFARLMMEIIQDIMRERINLAEDNIVPTHIYLDEFQNYLTPTIEEILSESRNYKFYVTFAHQSFVQLSHKMQGIVLSNSNIKIAGQCSYDNGKKMSKEMKADFETIETLKQGEFIFKIGSNDVVKLKNTDRFINDQTPYHTKQRTTHMKYQYKHYYVYKEDSTFKNDAEMASTALIPKYEEF